MLSTSAEVIDREYAAVAMTALVTSVQEIGERHTQGGRDPLKLFDREAPEPRLAGLQALRRDIGSGGEFGNGTPLPLADDAHAAANDLPALGKSVVGHIVPKSLCEGRPADAERLERRNDARRIPGGAGVVFRRPLDRRARVICAHQVPGIPSPITGRYLAEFRAARQRFLGAAMM